MLIAYLLGLGYANHMAGLLAAPAVARRGARFAARRRSCAGSCSLACIGALLLGMTPFLTQPIRAAHFPAINEGETARTLRTYVLHVQLQSRPVRQAALSSGRRRSSTQVGMWWLYFKWQWLRDAQDQ